MERVEEVPAGLVDAGGPRTAAAEQGHAAAHSCGSLRGHACGGGADPQYQRQTAGATVDAPTAARRVGHARRLVPTPAHAAKVHKPAWASTQKRGQLPMRWSSESGKKTCSQVDASTEAGFMHSYVVGHIGLDPSQPSILRNGDRGRRESSRQVKTPYRCHAAGRFTIVDLRTRLVQGLDAGRDDERGVAHRTFFAVEGCVLHPSLHLISDRTLA